MCISYHHRAYRPSGPSNNSRKSITVRQLLLIMPYKVFQPQVMMHYQQGCTVIKSSLHAQGTIASKVNNVIDPGCASKKCYSSDNNGRFGKLPLVYSQVVGARTLCSITFCKCCYSGISGMKMNSAGLCCYFNSERSTAAYTFKPYLQF